MHRIIALMTVLTLTGCAASQVPGYIQTEKYYTRQLSADIEVVYEAVKTVVARHGWVIDKVEDPATYERNEYTERVDQKRYLLITNIKKNPGIMDTGYAHLNIYLYQVNEWTDIDIRYERVKSVIKGFHKFRNDKLVNEMLYEIEKEIGG